MAVDDYREPMPFTIKEVVRLLGLEVKRITEKRLLINCPFCLGAHGPDTHGHLTVYLDTDSWKCHRCGRKGAC